MSTWTTEDRIAAEKLGLSVQQQVAELVLQKLELEKENTKLKEHIKYLESQVYGGTTK